MALREGAIFAGYRILRLLGSGGMGEVYLAQHPRLPRMYALKVLPSDVSADSDYRIRFNREADLAADLYHPNIVGVHDRGDFDDQLWIAMDYVDGPDCDRLLRNRYPVGMPAEEASQIVIAVADALDYAHEKGLLHRDVKPSNILLSQPESGQHRILLTDFGIARRVDDVRGLTITNMVMGTVDYSAPEQLMGEQLDGRADQYSLAVSAYQLLTGATPFRNTNPAVVIGHHLNSSPPALADQNSALAPMDPVFAVALAKNPDDRFRLCADFAKALTAAGGTTSPLARTVQAPATPPRVPSIGLDAMPLKPWQSTQPVVDAHDRSPAVALNVGEARSRVQSEQGRQPALGVRYSIVVLVTVLLVGAVTAAALYLITRNDVQKNNATSMQTSMTPTMTFDAMRDFVVGYYIDLPNDPGSAWAKLDSHCQQRTGESDFWNFWSTLRSVTVIAVNPRDTTSVTATLNYLRKDGRSDTEDRWLRMALVDGRMLLDESVRVSAAALPSSAGPSTTSAAVPTSVNADSVANQRLREIAAGDRPFVSEQLTDLWVPQISSKRPGVVDDGVTWDDVLTLREHLRLRQLYPGVRLLWSGDWSTFSANNFWVTIVGITYSDSGGALLWCRTQGLDRDHCAAKLVSTTHPVEGSSAYN
jgi:serine/threonine protein kinase